MSITVMSQATALNTGSDLWVVPNLGASRWTTKLDWYLNYQICKASRHKRQELPTFITDVLQETELPKPALPMVQNSPLMIASEGLLPNKWLLVLPWEQNMIEWAHNIEQIWTGLKRPTLRVFLPPGQNASGLEKEWPRQPSSQEFTVVLD